MRLQFLGCGDAFGSGGRFNTCFHVQGERANFLIDCGASSVIAMKHWGVDRSAIDTILVTHFHADHFGGIPFFILDAQFVSRRERPLTILGPRGLAGWYERAMETGFPGCSTMDLRFPLKLHELEVGRPSILGTIEVTPFPAVHDERAGPCLSLRIAAEGRVIAFSGDTEWTETLVQVGRAADLFICEAYVRTRAITSHMTLELLERNLARIAPKRLVLTHMSEEMLGHDLPYQRAEDGMVVTL